MVKKKYDFGKIKRIVDVLLENEDGIWLRKLSKESKIPVSTLHYYLESILSNIVDNIGARDESGKFFGIRVIKLKTGVFNNLIHNNSVETLKKILKTTEILNHSA